MFKIINKYKVLLYLAILGGGNIGEVYSIDIKDEEGNPVELVIGSSTQGNNNLGISSLTQVTHQNKWYGNTYTINASDSNSRIDTQGTVTINNGYTLKLINNCGACTLYCYNTFTNNGNVIIDNYGRLDLNNISINNGTIDINNGALELWNRAKLNNKGTITLKGSSFIDIYSNSTLTNTGTIDISNITNLYYWYNDGTFKLEGGSTFILPKSILEDSKKIGSTYTFNPITLNGTKDKPVNIVIPKGCKYITDIDNDNKGVLFNALEDATGLTFDGDKNNVKFSWQKIK